MLSDRFASLRLSSFSLLTCVVASAAVHGTVVAAASAQASPQPAYPAQRAPAATPRGAPASAAPAAPTGAPPALSAQPVAPPPSVPPPAASTVAAPPTATAPGIIPAPAAPEASSSELAPAFPSDQAAAGYPQQAPVYATPYTPDQTQQPYYGTYAPPAGYPASPSYAGPLGRAPGPGSHEHEGFFLRLSLGVGAAGTKYKERFDTNRNSDVKTRGLAVAFDVALGGRVVENFILHANLSFAGTDSNREIDGVKDRSYEALSTSMWMLGGGATYYFMPTNLYLTLVVGTGGFVENRDYGDRGDEEQIESGPGFASSLAIGKEWWVGGRGEWGIGASITGAFYVAPVDIGGVKSTAIGNCISLAFSATLN